MLKIFKDYKYIVGVDPGFTMTGAVCLISRDNSIEIVEQRGISSAVGQCREARVLEISDKVFYDRKIGGRRLFCIEENFVGPDSRKSLMTRELIGYLAAYAWKHEFDVVRVSPNEAKIAIVGTAKHKRTKSGRVDKTPIVDAASKIHGWVHERTKATREAVADAVGIAMAGAKITHEDIK